ncbi:MAG: tetratricopeptide repeat protein [Myxococcaceae bacterium]|nr:tetratricopeptide repeat protein [Myxococcaceae bacterium]
MARILIVADDDLEWQALENELAPKLELVRANGREQALSMLERHSDLLAVVGYWGALGSGPELMRRVAAKRPAIARVLICGKPEPEAQALISSGAVKAVVSSPAQVRAAFVAKPAAAAPAPGQHPLRAEPRTVVKLQLPVSTSAWEGYQALWTKDVSRGGVFFFFAHRVVPTSGSKCRVQLGDVTAEGAVAHVMTARLATATNTEAGFGVSFVAPQAVDWWVSLQRAQQPQAAPAPGARTSEPTAKEVEGANNFFNLAVSLYEQRNYGAARQKLELAARMAPNPKFEALQAACNGAQHLRLGTLKEAREAFERALLLDPACEQAKVGLSEAAKQKK